jgi:hypothetical protein
MGWRVQILPAVAAAINDLSASGKLSRKGMLQAYNAVRLLLPVHARHYQQMRYAADPDCFTYLVGFLDRGVWHRFTFHVNDSDAPGLLMVEGMTHAAQPSTASSCLRRFVSGWSPEMRKYLRCSPSSRHHDLQPRQVRLDGIVFARFRFVSRQQPLDMLRDLPPR